MRFGWRNLADGGLGHRWALSAFIATLLALWVAGSASAQMRMRKRDKGKGAPADAPVAEAKPPGPPLTKTQAVFSLVQALAVNQSDAALKPLEAIVEGKITFGGHNQQAAEMALVALTMRQSPTADAYLVKLISTPDETLRGQGLFRRGCAHRCRPGDRTRRFAGPAGEGRQSARSGDARHSQRDRNGADQAKPGELCRASRADAEPRAARRAPLRFAKTGVGAERDRPEGRAAAHTRGAGAEPAGGRRRPHGRDGEGRGRWPAGF